MLFETCEPPMHASERDVIGSDTPARSARLRVLIVISGLGRGGAERQAVALANHLDPGACVVRVISTTSENPLAAGLAPHVGFEALPKRWRFDVTMVWRLAAAIRRFAPDVVQAYHFDAEILSRVATALVSTAPVVGSERNSAHPGMLWRSPIDRLTTFGCSHIVANSRAGLAYRAAQLRRPPAYFSVVYNGVDAQTFCPGPAAAGRQRLALASDDRVVLMIANFKPQKNHRLFFEMASRVVAHVPSARFVLVGGTLTAGPHTSGPYEREVNALVDRLGLRPRCVFAGVQDDLAPLYRAADVVALTSLHEGTPNVVLEALACGRPVVVTDVADNREIVGDAGFVVPPGDPEVFAARVIELLKDGALHARLAARARQRALERFTFPRVAEETEAIYRRVIAARADRGSDLC
jgi:glycosyltransferase involved in cell wall biosynthesis